MIAKYNGVKVVRYGGKEATPYLRKNIDLFLQCSCMLDLGCGNGRNSRYLREHGIQPLPFDRCPDYGQEWKASEDIPVNGFVDGVLLNYILMFLTEAELVKIASEINRLTKSGAILMVELEVVKMSFTDTMEKVKTLKAKFMDLLRWEIVKEDSRRFIARKS